MDFAGNASRIKQAIASGAGKSAQEVETLVEAKKEKFAGLLTESGAAFMLAKELGINVPSHEARETRIAGLREGMKSVGVAARIKSVFPRKTFVKGGKELVMQGIVLWDGGAAEARVALWNKDAQKFSEMNLGKGDAVNLSSCSVTSYNNNLQLNLEYNGEIRLIENSALPQLEQKNIGITELEHGMNDVDVQVTLKKIFPEKKFENEKGEGRLINFIAGEGVNEIRGTAWNEACEQIEEFAEGDKVKIENAYAKEGMNGVELHLGKNARVVKDRNAKV